jgi:hypothetical protein
LLIFFIFLSFSSEVFFDAVLLLRPAIVDYLFFGTGTKVCRKSAAVTMFK